MLGMGGIRMEQAQMGGMEMGGMEGMEGMEGMKMDQGSTAHEQTVDGLTLTLVTTPDTPKKGENVIRLMVQSKEGPVTDAKITLAYTMAMPGMEVETVEAHHTKDGAYEVTVDLGMKGAWNIEATLVRAQGKPVKAKFTFTVK
jgi:Cu(I)/Ag(I) efflux system membrane fusion protein